MGGVGALSAVGWVQVPVPPRGISVDTREGKGCRLIASRWPPVTPERGDKRSSFPTGLPRHPSEGGASSLLSVMESGLPTEPPLAIWGKAWYHLVGARPRSCPAFSDSIPVGELG